MEIIYSFIYFHKIYLNPLKQENICHHRWH